MNPAWTRLSWPMSLVVLQTNAGQDSFLPNPFQFVVIYRPAAPRCILSLTKASLNKLRENCHAVIHCYVVYLTDNLVEETQVN
jgi:hypothetical protein